MEEATAVVQEATVVVKEATVGVEEAAVVVEEATARIAVLVAGAFIIDVMLSIRLFSLLSLLLGVLVAAMVEE